MKLTLIRTKYTDKSTTGILYIDGIKECYTLEDKVREIPIVPISFWKKAGITAIPRGTYKIVINMSPRFHKEMLMLLDVKGFNGVRIHSGNVAEDTEGCILVGTTVGTDRVNHSVDAMKLLYPKIKAALDKKEEVSITIK
jgi:hypothetical protein